VRAALTGERLGLIDNWLRHIQDVRDKHAGLRAQLNDEAAVNRLCELNVIEQVVNVARTTILRDAWQRGQSVTVHGWIYGLSNGQLRDLGISIDALDAVDATQAGALAKLSAA
jgi:carbonic anhydrase